MCKMKNRRYPGSCFLAAVLLVLMTSGRLSSEASGGNGRPFPGLDTSHAFIRYGENHLQFFGQPAQWNRALKKLSGVLLNGTGTFHFVHMGGSHVQAGMLTDRLRARLGNLMSDAEGERGLIFPYTLANTNSPSSIKVNYTGKWVGKRIALSSDSCRWGLSGISALTYDSLASLKLWTYNRDSANYLFDRVTLFSPFDSLSMEVQVEGGKEQPWLPGQPWRTYTFAQPKDTLNIRFIRRDSTMTCFNLQGLYLGQNRPGISYHTIGVNGASTAGYLRCTDLVSQFGELQPDVVVFGIGVNDANVPASDFDAGAFEARYDSLISRIRVHNPETAFLFITNNDTWYGKAANPNGESVRQAMYNLARRHHAAVFDFYAIMGGRGSIKKWYQAGLAQRDKIHLTRAGYELQADLMHTAFAEALGNYLDLNYNTQIK